MGKDPIPNLVECTEFRQTLQARPPRIVHGTAILLVTLLATALAWAALTRADLVVRASGRVRPVTTPKKVFNAGRGEVLSATSGGRVIAVNFHEGDEVKEGDVLIRLDTEHLDNEIAKRKRTIQACEEELAKVAHMEKVLSGQFEVARAKALAELGQAREEVRHAKERQAVDVRLAQVELESALDDEARLRKLVVHRAISETDFVKATARVREAAEKLARARVLVEEDKAEVARWALALGEKDYEVKRAELGMKRGTKQGEVEAARLELANLELERKQAILCAPIDGVVTVGDVKVGDVLETGKQVVEIAEQRGFRFEAAVPSGEVAHLRVGMPARIKLDAYDFQKYGTVKGEVDYISPDSGAQEKAPTSFYIVRIRVEGEEVGRENLRGRVKLGMGGQAEIVTDHESLLTLLVKKIRQSISLG